MRLLEFVSCGRPAVLPEDPPPSPRWMEEAPPSPLLTEEAAAPPLSPPTCSYAEKRRRRPSHGSASPWRPSLVAISEDGTPTATTGVAARGAGRGGGSRMSKAKSTGRVLARTERDDFRHYGVSTVQPTFSPTAFIF